METIYARRTTVGEIALEEAAAFLQENHRSGTVRAQNDQFAVALVFDGSPIAVALFGSPRTSSMAKRYSHELLRMAFRKGVRVPGGGSKLIRAFIDLRSPSDFFTYQDMAGEATAVYEHAGMTLVSQAKRKHYLVAPGRTLATASRKEALGMAYATRYGPDRILGTKLGEVFDAEGKRKSNRAIFIENLGWHVEETPGDRVYEWIAKDRTYYTYRITASDSEKYYYGVSHLKVANATLEDCARHHYSGSGGANPKNKFRNWKQKHRGSMAKEALAVHRTAAEAYAREAELVGDRHLTDPLCLNSTTGGKTGGVNVRTSEWLLLDCPIHGFAKHQGSTCMKCSIAAIISEKICEHHGLSKHRGDSCTKCYVQRSLKKRDCPVHGEVLFRGTSCISCSVALQLKESSCDSHGRVLHRSGNCTKCIAASSLELSTCEVHGESIHRAGRCVSCKNSSMFSLRECVSHGLVKHQGDSCATCLREKRQSLKECPVHGLVSHNGLSCSSCTNGSTVAIAHCPVHGNVKHQGSKCSSCSAQDTVNRRKCPVHGEVKHHGETCSSCTNEKSRALRECAIHGMTKHKGDSCYRCVAAARVSLEKCPTHGETKHRDGKCYRCMRAATKTAPIDQL